MLLLLDSLLRDREVVKMGWRMMSAFVLSSVEGMVGREEEVLMTSLVFFKMLT